MRLAVAVDADGAIAANFALSTGFLVYEVEGTVIVSEERRAVEPPEETATEAVPAEKVRVGRGVCRAPEMDEDDLADPHDYERLIDPILDCDVVFARGLGRLAARALVMQAVQPFVLAFECAPRQAAELLAAGHLRQAHDAGCKCTGDHH